MPSFLRPAILFCALAALPATTLAQTSSPQRESPPQKPLSDVSVLAYGAAHPDCLEWTDSCRTCMRSPDGRLSCSTPGIACQPKEIVCKNEGK